MRRDGADAPAGPGPCPLPEAVAAGELVVVEWGAGRALELPGRPDYVIHGAATTDPAAFRADPEGSFRDTVAMAEAVADGRRRREAGGPRSAAGRSTASSRPISPGSPRHIEPSPDDVPTGLTYAAAKRESERRFRAIDGDVRIARVFSLTGPYQDLGSAFAVPDLIRQAAEGDAITLTGDGGARRSFCYATDLAAILLWLLLGEPRHDVYNVGSRDGTATIAEVAQTIAALFGGLEVRTSAESGPGRDYVPNLDRLYEEFIPAVGLREGLLRTCHSMFARGVIGRRPAVELG